jgi:TfoX/Sxy family transcriptional regulator of competence genes
MALNESFKDFVLDQLVGLGEFEKKRMFGGVALLYHGSAFAKIKHDKVWLKVNESNRNDYLKWNMPQYT